MKAKQKIILYVDDDEDDRELFSTVLKENDSSANVVFAEDGLKALHYLDQVKKQPDAKRPCLIVLDLNMPYLDGRETFKRIKATPELDKIPVVIFTSSRNPNDQLFFHNKGIEFITKPSDFSFMNTIIKRMLENCS